MATIRRSGSGWQALIRKKKYQGQTSKTFSSKAAAKLWANAVESSLKTPAKLDLKPVLLVFSELLHSPMLVKQFKKTQTQRE